MRQFHKIWIEQCDATEGIRESFGLEKALGYLIGEKLLNFVQASETRPEWAAEIPAFLARIHEIFTDEELRGYFASVRRIGSLAHTLTDEQFEVFREAGAVEEDVASSAQDAIRLERVKRMLLGDSNTA